MKFVEIHKQLINQFGENAILQFQFDENEQFIVVDAQYLIEICLFLRDTEGLYFDFLHCISGVDYGEKENKLVVVYHIYSLPYNSSLVLKCSLTRVIGIENISIKKYNLPSVPSVVNVWSSAQWHEREVYDLIGINFIGNNDLRRMFMPEDWVGHPLRKDYVPQDSYHGVSIN